MSHHLADLVRTVGVGYSLYFSGCSFQSCSTLCFYVWITGCEWFSLSCIYSFTYLIASLKKSYINSRNTSNQSELALPMWQMCYSIPFLLSYCLRLTTVISSCAWLQDVICKTLIWRKAKATHRRACLVPQSCLTLATQQAPLSMEFSRQECWSGLPFSSSRASFPPRDWTHVSYVSCTAGRFFHCWAIGEPPEETHRPLCVRGWLKTKIGEFTA